MFSVLHGCYYAVLLVPFTPLLFPISFSFFSVPFSLQSSLCSTVSYFRYLFLLFPCFLLPLPLVPFPISFQLFSSPYSHALFSLVQCQHSPIPYCLTFFPSSYSLFSIPISFPQSLSLFLSSYFLPFFFLFHFSFFSILSSLLPLLYFFFPFTYFLFTVSYYIFAFSFPYYYLFYTPLFRMPLSNTLFAFYLSIFPVAALSSTFPSYIPSVFIFRLFPSPQVRHPFRFSISLIHLPFSITSLTSFYLFLFSYFLFLIPFQYCFFPAYFLLFPFPYFII